MKMQTLSSLRLQLQPQTVEHADVLFDLFQNESLYRFVTRTPPTSRDEFREGVRFVSGRWSADRSDYWLNWVAFDQQSGEITGQVEISLGVENREAYLAYWTFFKFWGQGLAKEACQAVLDHIFSEWGAKKVIIEMDVRNTASVRLAESLGASRVSFRPKVQLLKGEWSDEYRYELIKQ